MKKYFLCLSVFCISIFTVRQKQAYAEQAYAERLKHIFTQNWNIIYDINIEKRKGLLDFIFIKTVTIKINNIYPDLSKDRIAIDQFRICLYDAHFNNENLKQRINEKNNCLKSIYYLIEPVIKKEENTPYTINNQNFKFNKKLYAYVEYGDDTIYIGFSPTC